MSKVLTAFYPTGPRVLVKKHDTGAAKIGKIIIPQESEKYNPIAVEIVDPGEGMFIAQTGERRKPEFKVGQIVLIARWGGISLQIGGVEHLVIPENEVAGRAVFADEV